MAKKRRQKNTARARKRSGSTKKRARARRPTSRSLQTDIHRVLRHHGIAGEVTQLQLTPVAAVAAAAAGPCPPGTHRKLVCEFRDGELVCEERCVASTTLDA